MKLYFSRNYNPRLAVAVARYRPAGGGGGQDVMTTPAPEPIAPPRLLNPKIEKARAIGERRSLASRRARSPSLPRGCSRRRRTQWDFD
jgi:hypothetical protein